MKTNNNNNHIVSLCLIILFIILNFQWRGCKSSAYTTEFLVDWYELSVYVSNAANDFLLVLVKAAAERFISMKWKYARTARFPHFRIFLHFVYVWVSAVFASLPKWQLSCNNKKKPTTTLRNWIQLHTAQMRCIWLYEKKETLTTSNDYIQLEKFIDLMRCCHKLTAVTILALIKIVWVVRLWFFMTVVFCVTFFNFFFLSFHSMFQEFNSISELNKLRKKGMLKMAASFVSEHNCNCTMFSSSNNTTNFSFTIWVYVTSEKTCFPFSLVHL